MDHWPPFLSPSSFSPLIHIRAVTVFLNGLEFLFYSPTHTTYHQLLFLLFFSDRHHQTRRRVRWPRPQLRPRPPRAYFKRPRLDSYLRSRRRTRRIRRSRRLYLCYNPRFYPNFQSWVTDSLRVWLLLSRLVRVHRTPLPLPTTTRATGTRTTRVRYGCSRQYFQISFLTLRSQNCHLHPRWLDPASGVLHNFCSRACAKANATAVNCEVLSSTRLISG
jgi:hypothetical protein